MSLINRALRWIGLSPSPSPALPPTHRVFVSLHRGELGNDIGAGGLAALGLHEALTKRQLACALVDVDEWILRASLEEGRFRPIPEGELGKIDDLTGEPAWERERRADIGWLIANRSELIRDALGSGGDAQVVILLHSLDFMDLMGLWAQKGRADIVLLYYLGPNLPGLPGYILAPAAPKLGGPPVVYGDNPADDAQSWERFAKRINRLVTEHP